MFDNNNNVFGDDEGVFSDTDSVFGDEVLDSSNPAIPPEADKRIHSQAVSMSNARPDNSMLQQKTGGPVSLVAVYDESGQPMVARTVMENGRPVQLEEFRRPTPDEYNAIMFGGKIVQGGVVGEQVPTTTNLQNNLQKTPLGEFKPPWSTKKKVVVWSLVGLGALGAGYGIYRWRKAK